nr:MAG TPA: hypothetical protein [Caudoviricetes sp.]
MLLNVKDESRIEFGVMMGSIYRRPGVNLVWS